MPLKLLIDADPGIGDAVAIAAALADPDIDVVGITATHGTVSCHDATRNVLGIVEFLDPPKWPRLGACENGTAQPVREFGDSMLPAEALNGRGGLGDLEFPVADLHSPRESAKIMVDLVRNAPHEITLLTLGPLSNVAFACELAPDFLSSLRGLVCLGGAVACGGDVTAAAEFNVHVDPEAARNVLRSPATKTLVPLDVSSRVVLTFDRYSRLPGPRISAIHRLFQQLLPFAFRAYHEHLGLEGIGLQELVALAAVVRPQFFSSRSMAIDVETSGELTRGMTVFDRRGIVQWQTNIDVLHDVDVQGVLDYFTGIVRGAS